MDISAKLSALPGAKPLSGMPDAWEWSPAPGFVLLAALTSDRRHVFRLNTKDSYDAELCKSVLEFAREREVEAVARPEPLIGLSGFSWPGRAFDTVGRVRPEAHHLFPDDPALHDVVFGVFPAYSVEISGAESVQQAAERYARMLNASDMNRRPSPYVLIRFDNPKTGAGTLGEQAVFISPDYLLHELRLLKYVNSAYVELWNHRNERWRVRWDGLWHATSGGRTLHLSGEEIGAWASEVID
ncbi:hypothetical protein [Streptomyces sp. NPDC004286]|uniref:hypothetical protein n=1 Tax=Streptomyces sp. NPDC004286 TaxID=3364696 RepID=UPI003688047D